MKNDLSVGCSFIEIPLRFNYLLNRRGKNGNLGKEKSLIRSLHQVRISAYPSQP